MTALHAMLRALSLVLAAVGCVQPASSYIHVAVVNSGEREYDDVVVRCAECGYTHRFGATPPGRHTRHLMALSEVPKRFEVSFVDSGRARRVVLPVPPESAVRARRELFVVFRDGRDPVVQLTERSPALASSGREPSDSLTGPDRLFAALHRAVAGGDSAAVARLIGEGAPVVHDGESVLWLAVEHGGVGVLSAVLAKPLAVPQRHVLDAIDAASRTDDVAALRVLRSRAPWPAEPLDLQKPLVTAVYLGKGPSLRWFVEEGGVPINATVGQVGQTLLDFAVIYRKTEMAEYLRSKGGVRVTTKGR